MAAAFRRDIAVVEIEEADHDAVREHREIMTGLDAAAHDGRAGRRAHVAGELDGDLARRRLVAADRAADGVDDGALDSADHVPRQVLVAQLHRIVGERLRDRALIAGGGAGNVLLRVCGNTAAAVTAAPALANVCNTCRRDWLSGLSMTVSTVAIRRKLLRPLRKGEGATMP